VKLVLPLTGGLLLIGGVGFYVIEAQGVVAALPLGEKVLSAAFMSATTRTAGFATVDVSLISPATVLLLSELMSIGGAPGYTRLSI
jgi:trk system potassium uptake protein TrkH